MIKRLKRLFWRISKCNVKGCSEKCVCSYCGKCKKHHREEVEKKEFLMPNERRENE